MNETGILHKSETVGRTFIMVLNERQIEFIASEILQIRPHQLDKHVCEITEHGYWLLQEKERNPMMGKRI
jgi:hypothetical protein